MNSHGDWIRHKLERGRHRRRQPRQLRIRKQQPVRRQGHVFSSPLLPLLPQLEKMQRFHLKCTLLIALLLAPLHAAEPKLKVGDSAPPLQVSEWIQGEPVKIFEKDKVYLVEFWATWCGPCIQAIPHLNGIANRFKDKGLVVIGQNVHEKDLKRVRPFVKKMGDKMTYAVSLDDRSKMKYGAMAVTWLASAGQKSLPTTFVIGKDGRIAWIGHPMKLQENVIEQVLDGSFDVAKEATRFQEEALKNEQRAMDEEKALVEEVMKEPEIQDLFRLTALFEKQIRNKQWPEAEATLAATAKLVPAEARELIIAEGSLGILLGKGEMDAAVRQAKMMDEKFQHDPILLSGTAQKLLKESDLTDEGLEIAYQIAARVNEAGNGKSPDALASLARATFMKGDKEKAIQLQQEAITQTSNFRNLNPAVKELLQSELDRYHEGKLPPPRGHR
jgi:thiol-disulfide isomerase/thioredoxin